MATDGKKQLFFPFLLVSRRQVHSFTSNLFPYTQKNSRNCDPVLAKAGMSLRSFSARSGKTAEEIKRLDYCREGLRRMRLGQTKKKINTKAKNLEKKKNDEKEKEGEETRNQSSSGASASASCSADAIAEGVNTSAAAAAVQAKGGEEEENDATIADEACREDAAMALMSIAKAVTPA